MNNVSHWFFRLAVLYLCAGVLLGIAMAASHDHSLFPVHAHLNLLGWVTMGIFALFYRLWPEAATTRLAKTHFWIYVPANFVQMLALFAYFRGAAAVEPLLGAASALVGAAIVLFAFIAWKYTGATAGERKRSAAAGGLAAH
jgi:hypothetical protein